MNRRTATAPTTAPTAASSSPSTTQQAQPPQRSASRRRRRRLRTTTLFLASLQLLPSLAAVVASSFMGAGTTTSTRRTSLTRTTVQQERQQHQQQQRRHDERHRYQQQNVDGSSSSPSSRTTTTALNVWWFGGTETVEETAVESNDSCELVPVRIERTSSNSRKIMGEIVAPCSIDDVWSILTDYDRLAVHVPNLVESRVLTRQSQPGSPGDGSYRCRLFQKGAQKIIGFEFGASVTMDMREVVGPEPRSGRSARGGGGRNNNNGRAASIVAASAAAATTAATARNDDNRIAVPSAERRILFKCYESFFFSEFDGEWKVQERIGEAGEIETVLSYVVDVRPKGPVPVAALEWRIREDVPTNLRAVKRAAMARAETRQQLHEQMQQEQERVVEEWNPVLESPNGRVGADRENRLRSGFLRNGMFGLSRGASNGNTQKRSNDKQQPQDERRRSQQQEEAGEKLRPTTLLGDLRASVVWDRDETMAAYLD